MANTWQRVVQMIGRDVLSWERAGFRSWNVEIERLRGGVRYELPTEITEWLTSAASANPLRVQRLLHVRPSSIAQPKCMIASSNTGFQLARLHQPRQRQPSIDKGGLHVRSSGLKRFQRKVGTLINNNQ